MKHLQQLRSCLALICMGVAVLPAAAAEETGKGDIWDKVRKSLFDDRPISTDAEQVIQLETPVRAEDAATVPIAIKTRAPQTAARYVKKIYLLIDKNPSPIAAIFTLTPDSGRADIETRVRIEEYTDIRAVAEMNDGKLFMAKRYIKASGGCSAPAGKDLDAALASVGRMKLRLDGDVTPNEPVLAQLMISHPNLSGLAKDQVTHLYTPAYFVRKIDVSYAGRPVLSAEVDFSISENPNFRFYFVPRGDGELKADVVDSRDLTFESKLMVKTAQAGAAR
jgi:sulfur-oxidizing protein SoxY